jgi:hypothetical protein
MGENGVLLPLVESVDLVDEEDGSLPVEAEQLASRLYCLT